MLDEAARSKLREIAEAAVRTAAGADAPEVAPDAMPALDAPCGAFVTLKIGGKLRGCIGTIQAARPARETVREMAESAAVRDPRFPSLDAETFGNVILEAWAYNKQLVTTAFRGAREIIREGEDALMAPCGDGRTLAHAIRQASEEGDLMQAMTAAGQDRLRRDFSK